MADFDHAIALDGDRVEAYHNRGLLFRKRGQEREAAADLERARVLREASQR